MVPRDRIEYWYGDRSGPGHRLGWSYDVKSSLTEAAEEIADAFPRAAADLWEIAASCYAVDRRCPRPSASGGPTGDRWRRALAVRMPVRERLLWEELKRPVEQLLAWLTCDRWELDFRDPRPGELRDYSAQGTLPPFDWPDDRVAALFSGGLDSTAGLLHDLYAHTADCLVAVSVATSPLMRSTQEQILERARTQRRGLLTSVPFKLSLARRAGPGAGPDENTQRTRGFVFLSAGIVAALTARCGRLRIYENGIGAINLPCTWGQVGAQAAHPVHPRTISLMSVIADGVTRYCGRSPVTLETPHLTHTKAQMIKSLPEAADPIIGASISCDSGFSQRRRKGEPYECGGCSSCILRRQALIAAGRSDLEDVPYRGAPESKKDHLGAMLWQVARLASALSDQDPSTALIQEFPDLLCLPRALDRGVQDDLIELYQNYYDEWSVPGVADRLAFTSSDWGL
jgi:hypothetical protein